MKTSPTSIAGYIGGAACGVAAVPGMPPAIHTTAALIGAVALGALGRLSKDCPPLCPGTDALGRPRPTVENTTPPLRGLLIPVLALCGLSLGLLSGCTAFNASTHTTTQTTNGPVVEKTRVLGWTLLDSSQAIQKASAHSGYATNGTWAPGVNMAGLTQTSSSTGLVNGITVIVNNLPPVIPAAAPTK
jgi:hypothetical protein